MNKQYIIMSTVNLILFSVTFFYVLVKDVPLLKFLIDTQIYKKYKLHFI